MQRRNLMLVGSIAYDTAEQAFRAIGRSLGEHLDFMPDGEVGERESWVAHIAYRVFLGHPDIELISRPLWEDGTEEWRSAFGHKPPWKFRVRDGIKQVRFGDPGWRLGYARDAINSYFIFKTLKQEGAIPAHMRFQICLPHVSSGVRLYFDEPADYPRIEPAFAETLRLEAQTICDHLPADEIAIQWDCAIEDTVIEHALEKTGGVVTDEVRSVVAELFAPTAHINSVIPEAAHVGYHACYGTSGGWPRREPQDLTGVVLLLNGAVLGTGRSVQFAHMPTVQSSDANYFAPLADLDIGDTRLYVGLIHALHEEDGLAKQMQWIGNHVADFGIAAPCGFGRGPGKMSAQTGLDTPGAYMDSIIADHLSALHTLNTVTR